MAETMKGKAHAMKMLAERRATKYDIPHNSDLPAGSPMYFACIGCGAPLVVPEGYFTKPDLCVECEALKRMGWLDS